MILHIVSFQVKRVSLFLEELLFLIGQGVRHFAFPSSDGIGTLLVRSELPLILLPCSLNHTLQDQVSNLKFVNLHLLMVRDPDLLLV